MVVSVLPSGVGATSSTKAWMGSLALAVATAGNSLGQTVWPILHEGEGGGEGRGARVQAGRVEVEVENLRDRRARGLGGKKVCSIWLF